MSDVLGRAAMAIAAWPKMDKSRHYACDDAILSFAGKRSVARHLIAVL